MIELEGYAMMDGKVGDPGYSCEDGAVHRGIGRSRETNIRRLAGRAVLRQFTSACGNVRLESQYGTVPLENRTTALEVGDSGGAPTSPGSTSPGSLCHPNA